MAGYSSMRTSSTTFMGVYGKWQIPTSYAGLIYTDWHKNVLPEMFFGFYSNNMGLDRFLSRIRSLPQRGLCMGR